MAALALVSAVVSSVVAFGYLSGDGSWGSDQRTEVTVPVSRAPVTTRLIEPIPEDLPEEVFLPSEERSVEAGCVEPIAVSPPAPDFADTVAAAPPGTCFLLESGMYRFRDVVPKDYMSFVGTSASEVIVQGDEATENAFHGVATGVTIARMTFSGFQGSGGEKRQEQAPIRGTSAIWASDRGQMATEWLIEGIVSVDNYASGVFLGDDFTIRGSRFERNGVAGLTGSEVVGGLIESNLITMNGAEQAEGFEVNGGGMKFGESGTEDEPLVVRGNEVFDNVGIGVWCDIGCRGFHVIDNYIHDQSSRAVMFELSRHGIIRGNTIIDANTWADFGRDFNAGAITVGESSDVLIEGNYIEGAKSAVTIRQTARPVRPQESFLDNYDFVEYLVSDVLVRANVIRRSDAVGISTGKTGIGLIEDPTSIRFEGNAYDDPESMTFWWNDGERMDFVRWQEQGRDVSPAAVVVADVTPWSDPGTTTTSAAESPSELEGSDPVTAPVRINAGGRSFVASDGAQWIADEFFIGGFPGDHDMVDVAGTVDDEMYSTERWGLSGYSVPVENGSYRVVLHHAEIFDGCQNSGCRRFSVVVEETEVVAGLDLFALVGGRTAVSFDAMVEVQDGFVDVEFTSTLQEAQIAGIEILPVS